MSGIHPSVRVHPTAIIDPAAEIGPGCEVGPFSIIEGAVRLGENCALRAHVHLMGPLTMGPNNTVHTGAVLGDLPQHLRYNGEPTSLVIGANNTFRENTTAHRATVHSGVTVVGDDNYFMAGSHVAHDCVVGSSCMFANGSLLGGHCTVGDRAFLSGNVGVHQFCRVGRVAMLSGGATATKDAPPFTVMEGRNCVVGVNVVGMRRAGFDTAEIMAVRRAYRAILWQGRAMSAALAEVERDSGHVPAVAEVVKFIRTSLRGVPAARSRRHAHGGDEAAAA